MILLPYCGWSFPVSVAISADSFVLVFVVSLIIRTFLGSSLQNISTMSGPVEFHDRSVCIVPFQNG